MKKLFCVLLAAALCLGLAACGGPAASADYTVAIVQQMDRGVTILHGEGAYSGAEKKVLLVAFKQRQIVAIKRLVKELDPAAFIIVCEAHEILGDGFREYKHNDL